MKRLIMKLVEFSINRPKLVIGLTLAVTLIFALQFPKIRIDTDPENMLRQDEPVRVFHREVKKAFGIEELIVLGIVRDDGIFHIDTLDRIKRITDEILKLKGVIADDVLSLSVTNNVVAKEGILTVRPPMAEGDIEGLKREVLTNPLFKDRLVSGDGKGAAIYIPIETKDIAHEIGEEIKEIYKKEKGPERYYMAGLPIAEDTFGSEMFIQMAFTAPMAGFLIMIVLFFIFRRFSFIISPMLLAMISVAWTMGLMTGLRFNVHIMSSMIPVFLMPMAICDSVHILSDFFEKLPRLKDRRKTVIQTFDELIKPMFFTSVTTMVGFANLALANIPPVRIFGLFVAFGIGTAWLLTMTFIPAALMLIKEKKAIPEKIEGSPILAGLGRYSLAKSKAVVFTGAVLLAIAIYGVTTLRVNDNPVKWFKRHHPVRVADEELNKLIGGTYISYLVFSGEAEDDIKRPDVIGYIEKLQRYLENNPLVGKTTSIADVVKRVNYVLHDEDRQYEVLPNEKDTIGQYLFLFLMSSSPDELDNLVDYTYKKANIWVQLKSGDNRDMTGVVEDVERYVKANPLPGGIKMEWSGLPYLNITWQRLMVTGMLKATIGSWWMIFILLIIQFRSFWWGLIGMLPLGLSVLFSYGLIGFLGKDYDMPVAVCSTLALGLGVDFAIHFVQRFRDRYRETKDLKSTMEWTMGGEPALAIFRNALVVGLGFLPMVIATLTPYVTVGLFFGSLTFFAGVTTLIFLPALIRNFRKILLCAMLFTLALSGISFAQEEIIAKSRLAFYYAGNDMRAKVLMELINKDGQKRVRELTMLKKDYSEGGDQRYYMYFHKPNDVKGTAFMVYKYALQGDDRWLFIPAINLVKRIAADDRYSSFVGSDFTYEDVSGRKPEEDSHRLLREEGDAYVIESIPKTPSEYTKRISWIDKTNFLPIREEFYDRQNELYREFSSDEIKDINGIPTAAKRTMKNIKTGHRTEVTFHEVSYNLGIGDDIFTERYLRRPPGEWIK